ncbi:MAG: hypothetical protein P8X60_05735 [Robiginitalea sp.]
MNRILKILILIGMIAGRLHGQDCALGIGGTDPGQIMEVFELDDDQKEQLQHWVQALESENTPLQKTLDSLLAIHPQETPEQLTALGRKFENIKEKMVMNSLRYDQLLLGIFRPGQYRKYEILCKQIGKLPLEPATPTVIKEKGN